MPEAPADNSFTAATTGAEDLYLANRSLIDEVIRSVSHRRGFRGDDADEFAGWVRLRLVESNYAALRSFQGRSTLKTYLTVVINRLALDYRISQWGKWHPSAVARAGGAAAVRLEQLLVRDGLPRAEALDTVDREFGGATDRAALDRLAARFPLRSRRHYVGEEFLEAVIAATPDAEGLLMRTEAEDRFQRVAARLKELMSGLSDTDRLVLQMRFEQGLTVAQVARLLKLDQKRLYRRIEHALSLLRTMLEAEGLRAPDVMALLAGTSPHAYSAEHMQPVRLSDSQRPR